MELNDWITPASVFSLLGALGTFIGFYIDLRKLRVDREQGITDAKLTARRDSIDDREYILSRWRDEIDRMDARVKAVEGRLKQCEHELAIEKSWVKMLQDHIYTGKKPPPPERPQPYTQAVI